MNAAIVAVVPFFVLFPWSLHLLTDPTAFITEAGLQTAGLTTTGLGPAALLGLSPGGPGLPPVWVTAGFALALVAAVLPTRRTWVTGVGWCAAIVGLLAAVTVSRLHVPTDSGGQAAAGWPGVALALAALGLLLAAAPAAGWLADIIRNERVTSPDPDADPLSRKTPAGSGYGRFRRIIAGVALVAAGSAPLLVAGYWVKDGVQGPVGSVAAPLLPAFVAASSTSSQQYRTLILRPHGDVLDYDVVRQGDPTLGEPELTPAAAATQALSRQVAALGAPDGADAGDPGLVLGSFGIRWVLLPGPIDAALAQRLDAAVGLVLLSTLIELRPVAGGGPGRAGPGGRPRRHGDGARLRPAGPERGQRPGLGRHPGAGRALRRVDRIAQRAGAAAGHDAGRRLGPGVHAPVRRRSALDHQEQPRPDGVAAGRAGRAARRLRARAAGQTR